MVRVILAGALKRAVIALAAAAALSSTARAALVVNGGFEAGDFTGWTLSGDTHASGVVGDGAKNAYLSQSGSFHVESGTLNYAPISSIHTPFTMQQTIQTFAGDLYDLSFWVNGIDQAEVGAQVRAVWGGQTVLDTGNYFTTKGVWTEYDYTVTATSAATTLVFDLIDARGETGLDSVSVVDLSPPQPTPPAPLPAPPGAVPVPEPASSAALLVMGLAALVRCRAPSRRATSAC